MKGTYENTTDSFSKMENPLEDRHGQLGEEALKNKVLKVP